MKVSDVILGQQVVTARMDASLGDVAALMSGSRITGVPIVDDWGALCGLVTAGTIMDLARTWGLPAGIPSDGSWGGASAARAPNLPWQKLLASDVMTSDLCTVMHDEDLTIATRSMVNRGVHRAVVLGKDRNVMGVLSALDVVLMVAEGRLSE